MLPVVGLASSKTARKRRTVRPAVVNSSMKSKSIAWNVYRKGRLFDTVWFDENCDEWYVLRALIDHDGYPADITVRQ
jgi:hypothetical protein